MKSNLITILDCTLRDGSYLIDYQFTAEDTYIITLGLVRAGFRLIEIGHGTGLGSSDAGKGRAAASDEEYLKAAKSAIEGSAAKFGMFFIPGIGRMDHLVMAADYGMNFVRIGTNVTEIESAKTYIERSKELGMVVASNLMKSYAVSYDEFIKLAKKADDFGADIITVVDSAGGMLPHEINEYVLRLRDVTDKIIGFHGHNNLQLAIANTLEAVKAGAKIVDSSLQGMGRSAGNAQTEVLAMVLEKLGYNTCIDTYKTMDIGERIIKPMMNREQGVDDISLVSGIAQFHSSYYQMIDDTAKKYEVDPRRLIIEVSDINRVHVTKELAEKTALRIRDSLRNKKQQEDIYIFNAQHAIARTPLNKLDHARYVINDMLSRSKKIGKESVFSISLSGSGLTSFPFVKQSHSFVIGNTEVTDLQEASDIIEIADGMVDWILLDESCPQMRSSGLDNRIRKSKFTWYSEERALRLGICTLLSLRRSTGDILILSDEGNASLMKLYLSEQGMIVHGSFSSQQDQTLLDFKTLGAIVSFGSKFAQQLTDKHVSLLPKSTCIYAARPRAFPHSFWEAALAKGLAVCRVDARAAFSAEMALVIETKKTVDMMGSAMLAGVPIVAGGVIGPRGSVIVDSVKKPTRVIGMADGSGGLLPPEEETPYLHAKQKIIAQLMNKMYEKEF